MGGARGGNACFAKEVVAQAFSYVAGILDGVVENDSAQALIALAFDELVELDREGGLRRFIQWTKTSPTTFDSNADIFIAIIAGIEGRPNVMFWFFL